MPITPVPKRWLSDTIVAMQRQLDTLTRASNRPTGSIRDTSNNVLHMADGHSGPVLAARGQGVSLVMANGSVTVADESGRNTTPLTASNFTGSVTGDTHGVHHGDVGVNGSEFYSHYGDLHGNGYGFWYGPVGDGATQNQINALNIFATGVFSNIGIPGQNWTLYGTVVAPSERRLKTDIADAPDAGGIVDAVPAYRWRWRNTTAATVEHVTNTQDTDTHVGPMVDDLARHAPWLVRQDSNSDTRGYNDRDLIGVLWAALRDTRTTMASLHDRIAALENQLGTH